MKSKYNRVRSCTKIKVAMFVIAINILFFPTLMTYSEQGDNRFTISLDGVTVGVTDDIDSIFACYQEARLQIARESGGKALVQYPALSYKGEEVLYGDVDDEDTIIANMKAELLSNKVETVSEAYIVKVGDIVLNLSSAEDTTKVFQTAVSRYDVKNKFKVELVRDTNRELNVLEAVIYKKENSDDVDWGVSSTAGFENDFTYDYDELLRESAKGFEAYDYGIESMEFSENIEVVEAYVPYDKIMTADEAIDMLFNEQETQQIYEVQSGDTLSGISVKVGLPLDEIIALNTSIDNENSIINIGQKLIITVPEPELSVIWVEQAKLEEAYNAPTEYIYNDSWFTNQIVTHQQPSAGYHEAVLTITHSNDLVTTKETVYEEILIEPVAKVVEQGTMIPPTYVKPISGGVLTSGFGGRRSPGGIGSTNHKGVDWGTPIGTPVYASCGGVVLSAGWSGGYGYCVYISHPDGKQTRYAHCSQVKVSKGQTVSQGQLIAYSGNTGNSTGPHLHFEIIVNGVQVNPFDYL